MSKTTKSQLAFLLVVICGVGLFNCKPKIAQEVDQEGIARAEQREIEFMQRRAEYIKENGHAPNMNQQLKPSSMLIQKNETHDGF